MRALRRRQAADRRGTAIRPVGAGCAPHQGAVAARPMFFNARQANFNLSMNSPVSNVFLDFGLCADQIGEQFLVGLTGEEVR